jgi:hypothetical protein
MNVDRGILVLLFLLLAALVPVLVGISHDDNDDQS